MIHIEESNTVISEMQLVPNNRYKSPNFSSEEIPIDFVVLHYTACGLEKTMEIFLDPQKKVCAHFVIDIDGTCFDLGSFWSGPIRRGAHAGESSFTIRGQRLEGFNKFSIGIELVNHNGNIFDYTKEQYKSLVALVQHLMKRFPSLNSSERIIGHEQIAGFRGKCDPGICFDWNRLWRELSLDPVDRAPLCNEDDIKFINDYRNNLQQPIGENIWSELSSKLETRIADRLKLRG